jgi:hypothetical protein
MEKIPTAEELAIQMQNDLGYEDLVDRIRFASLVAVELTKIHVQAALKEASENADTCEEPVMRGHEVVVDKDSILNAYPLNLIK